MQLLNANCTLMVFVLARRDVRSQLLGNALVFQLKTETSQMHKQ